MGVVHRLNVGLRSAAPAGFAAPRGTRALLDEGRGVLEFRSLMRDPVWTDPPLAHGNQHPVLLIPGFLAGDLSLGLLARWLSRAGYVPLRSHTRLNIECAQTSVERIAAGLEVAALRAQSPVTLIGHSLGGIFAKVLAMRRPELVAGVAALGSPLLAPTVAHRFLRADLAVLHTLNRAGWRRAMSADCVHGECGTASITELNGEFPAEVPFVSLYSRADGFIDWRACLDPAAHAVEVSSTHCGMPMSVDVFRALADHLPRLAEADPLPGVVA